MPTLSVVIELETIKHMRIDPSIIENAFADIPEGTVEMRDDRIQKVWKVDIKAFKLSYLPVTQELYETIGNKNPSTFKGSSLPVETVSWMDAVMFCNQLSEMLGKELCYIVNNESAETIFKAEANGFRLPTEAEWQYACQCGEKALRYGDLDDIAWYKDNSKSSTHKVGQKQANKWGLYDMLGNVWEWCTDIYDETIYGSYRVFRGGGWSDRERSVMATTRRRSHPVAFKIEDLGFRIAQNG